MAATDDAVHLEGLTARTILGVHEWERREPRPVRIDLHVGCDARRAARKDDLRHAVDYHRLAASVVELLAGLECRLVETLAERIADHVLRTTAAPWVQVRVAKPGAVPDAREVAVSVERRRTARAGTRRAR